MTMLHNVESLVRLLGGLEPARDEVRDAKEVFSERLYLALDGMEHPELFVTGPEASFGKLDPSPVYSWGQYQLADSGTAMPALVVRTSAGSHGQRLMAHLAYEALHILAETPAITNSELVKALQPFLRLALSERMLTTEEQVGLVGELQFLSELLALCATEERQRAAIAAWVGPGDARRDFYRANTAVEVKASSGLRHHVGYLQMVPEAGESLYLASVRVRPDASASLKLPDLVHRVEEFLKAPDLREELTHLLAGYGTGGYHQQLAGQYRLCRGFFVDAAELRRISEASPTLRPASFVDGQPSQAVTGIHYYVDMTGTPPMTPVAKRQVLEALIGG